MAESSRAVEGRAALLLPEEIVDSILARLPTRSLARFLVTCKPWCRRASEGDLLLAHHLRQPAQPLLCSHRNVKDEDIDAFLGAYHYYCLQAVDLRAVQPLRMVVRFKDTEYIMDLLQDRGVFDVLEVHGSCDGLLLLNYLDAFFVCNPATRQWAPLPPLSARDIAGFYAHAPSGEYRVLYHRSIGIERKYYVLTVGSQQARCIERRASSASVGDALSRGLERAGAMPPVLFHGSLHWPPQSLQEDNILVFDTAAEAFSWMRPPVVSDHSFLFETKDGKLALSCWDQNEWRAELWIMQDYKNYKSWVRTHQIELLVLGSSAGNGLPRDVAIVSQEGDVLVEFSNRVLHCDNKGTLLHSLNADGPMISFTRHMLKESLIAHPFLRKHQDGDTDGPPFFKRL